MHGRAPDLRRKGIRHQSFAALLVNQRRRRCRKAAAPGRGGLWLDLYSRAGLHAIFAGAGRIDLRFPKNFVRNYHRYAYQLFAIGKPSASRSRI
jgi:hypothetical protein